ncbi:MAG: ABC-2 family transporter protein [Candidatus Pacebacteria bacterium]|nr:ABC-2 family transporter protein [Candidatus Paceibacterota bacterium]
MYKGLYYIYIVSKNSFEQKKKVVFQMINHIIFLLFSIYLYKYVYELVPSMQGRLPLPNAIWSMSMYFIVFWLGFREIEKSFRNDIKSGNIELYLLRPVGYIWQKVFFQIGQGLISFIFATIFSVTISYFLIGLPAVDASIGLWIFGVLLVFILSQILICLIFITCGLTSFWIEDSEPIYFIVTKMMMIFGGAWVPVAFFPKFLQLFAIYSPFGSSMAVSFAMYPDFIERIPVILGSIIFWIVVFLITVVFISKSAFKKLAVNG